jgi:type II secretory pathway component PulF
MDVQDLLELVFRSGDVVTRMLVRVAQFLVEWLFVAATWIALLVIGVVMAFQRGGLPWTDRSDARATSRSPGSTVRRAPLR